MLSPFLFLFIVDIGTWYIVPRHPHDTLYPDNALYLDTILTRPTWYIVSRHITSHNSNPPPQVGA